MSWFRRFVADDSGAWIPLWFVGALSAIALIVGLVVGLFNGDWSIAGAGVVGLLYVGAWWGLWRLVALVKAPFRRARLHKAHQEFVRFGPVQGIAQPSGLPAADWLPAGPTHRHEYRYWTGTEWASAVSDGGVRSMDKPDV